MLCGICVGWVLHRCNLVWLDKAIIYLIRVLLFILGIEIGCNEMVISSLHTLGLNAVIIAIISTAGSCIAAYLLSKWIGYKKVKSERNWRVSILHPLKGSMIILIFFALGVTIGVTNLLGGWRLPSNTSFYTLAVLIFSIGITIGHNRSILPSLKALDKRVLFLPLGTILGAIVAISLFSPLLPFSTTECMAIASGQAYYSLSSIMIAKSKGLEMGTVALLANVAREIIALVFAPILYRITGPLSPIAAGGATTADTTLPIIRQVCGQESSVIAIYHGFVVDFSVPFMVALFCAI